MKKNGIALAIILIILVMTLVACGENDFDTCVHNVVIDEAVSATCTEKGLTEGKHCSKCGEVLLAQTEVPALGHTYLDDGSCSICGYQEFKLSLNADGESYTITGLGEDFEGTELVIPAEYNGKPVTTIGAAAFFSCDSLTSIVIPDSVTTIGEFAFFGCTSLTSITIPDSVTTIGYGAFEGCSGLTDVYYTGDIACWCGISFGSKANPMCYADNLYIDGKLVEGELIIPDEVTSIPAYAFRGQAITNIVIPDSVTTIGSSAFYNCSSLTSVTIGNSVTTIGDQAFYGCNSLTSIVIPDSVTTIGSNSFYNCDSLTYNVYDNGKYLGNESNPYLVLVKATSTSITSCEINENCKVICYGAFEDCISLTSVTFGENSQLTTIGDRAFNNCSSLTSIVIPASVITIGKRAFADCTSLTSVTFGENSQLTTIGSYAFCDCISLTSIVIPDSVTTIGSNSFYNCYSLTSISVDENNPNYKSMDGNLYSKDEKTLIQYAIGKTATSFVIPDSVTTIGPEAFHNCNSLTSIEIPSSVTVIGDGTFIGCSSLTSVTFGENSQLTTIGASAFRDCTSLTSIVIPDSVTTIDLWAFDSCFRLASVTIGSSVTAIGSSAFADCTSLTSVTFGDPNGWYVTKSEGATSGTNLTLTDPSTNAKYLKSTYYNYYWYKK